ncbi:MAG: flippase [Candidatus Sedimenticola sp. 20ELBAFRAG]
MGKIHRLFEHVGLRKYFINTSWLMGEQVLRMLANLVVGIYVARYLGPLHFGELSFSLSFCALFSHIVFLGLDGVVVRELVSKPSRHGELLGTSLILKLLSGFLTLAFVVSIVQSIQMTEVERWMICIISGSFIFQSVTVISFYFQAAVKGKALAGAQLFQLGLTSLFRIVLVLLEADLIFFAAVALLEIVFVAFALIFNYRKEIARDKLLAADLTDAGDPVQFNWSVSISTAKELLRDSWPLMLSGVAISVYMKIDQVMLRGMLGADAVGQYAAAVRISEAWYLVPVVIVNSLFPAIVNAKNKDSEVYTLRLQRLYGALIWLGIVVSIITVMLADLVVSLLFGHAYYEASGLLKIHIWAGIFVCVGVAATKYLIAENYTTISFVNTLIGAIVNVILNYFLIPLYGSSAAAFTTVVSYALSAFIMMGVWRLTRDNFFMMSRSAYDVLSIFREIDNNKNNSR